MTPSKLLIRRNNAYFCAPPMGAGSKKLLYLTARLSSCTLTFVFILSRIFAQTAEKTPSCDEAALKVEQGQKSLAQGDPSRALQVFQSAQILCPEKREIALDMAKAHLALKEFAEAEGTLRGFLDKDPASEQGMLILADCYYSEGRLQDAWKLLERLLTQNRQNVAALRLLGLVFFSAGDFPNAERFLLEYLKSRPEDSEALESLGGAYYFQREYKKAIETFKQLVALHPTSYGAYDRLATTYQALQETDKAIELFKKAQALSPKKAPPDDMPFTHLAQALTLMHREAEALPYVLEAVRINPSSALNHYILGNSLFHRNDLRGAEEHLRKAAEMDASDPQPHYLLATIYRKLGKPNEARREFSIFRELNQSKEQRNRPKAPDSRSVNR